MRIALDAMGGDFGPPNLVAGAVMALRAYPYITQLFLVGDAAKVEAELKKHGCTDGRIEIVHASQVVEMSDGAVEAVRRKKDSSVSRAVDLVKHGKADAIVSAGHTGAAVAATAIKLRMLPAWNVPASLRSFRLKQTFSCLSTLARISTHARCISCNTGSWAESIATRARL